MKRELIQNVKAIPYTSGEAIDRAAQAAALIVSGQMAEAMNQFNRKKE